MGQGDGVDAVAGGAAARLADWGKVLEVLEEELAQGTARDAFEFDYDDAIDRDSWMQLQL